jgi:hypothetical protein
MVRLIQAAQKVKFGVDVFLTTNAFAIRVEIAEVIISQYVSRIVAFTVTSQQIHRREICVNGARNLILRKPVAVRKQRPDAHFSVPSCDARPLLLLI